MKIDDYELLLKLSEIGTIRGTAKAVLISQPAVTQRLKYIEEYFGHQVFIRTPKRLLPTPEGEIVLKHAKEVIDGERSLKNQLAQSSEDVQGTLSIACSSLISQRFLPAILGNFTALYPKVAIDLVTGISEDIKRDHKNYHVCIIRGEKLKESTCIQLFDDPLYIFDTEPFPHDSLKERPLISFSTDDSMHELVDNWLYAHQDKMKPVKTITVDQIETCKQFMKQGLGMAVLPESVSDTMREEYPNLPLTLNNQVVSRHTWVCFQEGVRALPQVDHFIDKLVELLST
ncbi:MULTISPECIES: LysR family transcriptional regulator [Virgibacillus]|uniref:CysJI operon transcriptional activator n=1 Tax=Virgibacillus massiliensis TaxID=1462526 RepID=A0A024QDZ2_9BACI|nr:MULTISPECIES: LysR family transcriptional regulator [Virgibacillus]EQB36479.1 transcriptional regulator [Virgibacillus sp. CM-4]MYL42312.1 LysR family transcriptional regulator [Virgibacillus massiliensis]CDQ40176.1 CysJI operon transcriptional activator [Virgibacillus massiliensis]